MEALWSFHHGIKNNKVTFNLTILRLYLKIVPLFSQFWEKKSDVMFWFTFMFSCLLFCNSVLVIFPV